MSVPIKVNLEGKVAVITGAGGVICGAMAKAIAECGAKVAVFDLSLEKATIVADEIVAAGGIAKPYACNVLKKDDLAAAHAKVLEELGPCDILVNGAGGNHPRAQTTKEYYEEGDLDADTVSFFDLDQSGVEFVFNLNIIGTLLPTQEFAKDMVEKKSGNILNVSSMNAYTPLTKIPAYSSAKAGVSNLTQWLAVHFSKVGIRVNAIAPGFLLTAQNRSLLLNEDGSPTPRSQKILAATPMDRMVAPEELLGGTLFLISDEAASAITGVVLPIDAGFSSYAGV